MEKQRHYFANKGPSSQGYGFSSGHVWMWELDCEESWVPKNWCFWTVVLEKTLESPLDCKEIQPVHPKGGQSWEFIGRIDVEAETPILWPPHVKSWLIGKDFCIWPELPRYRSLFFSLPLMIKLVRNHHRFVNGLTVSAYGLCNLLLLLAIFFEDCFNGNIPFLQTWQSWWGCTWSFCIIQKVLAQK